VGASPSETSEDAPSPPGWRLWRARREDLLPLVLVVVMLAGAGGVLIRGEQHFGPIDEFQHFNYITELVYHHRIPVPGDVFTQEAMRAHACRAEPGVPGPACDSASFNPSDFETGGQGTAGGYPPAYYAPTALVAWAIATVTRARDLVVPARIASLLWLLLGAVLTYLLARSFAAGRWVAGAVTLLAALAPMMLYQGSSVNPDSMSLLAGAGTAIAWLSLRASSRWKAFAALLGVMTFVALIKPNFLAVPIAVALAEIALASRGGWRPLVRRAAWSWSGPTLRVCLAAATAVVLGVSWSAFFRLVRAAPSGLPVNRPNFGAAPWNADVALRGWASSLAPLVTLPKISGLNTGGFLLFSTVVNVLVVSGALGAAMLSRRRELPEDLVSSGSAAPVDPLRAVGYLATASLVVAAPVTYALVAASGAFIVYPPRYSLFIAPLGLVALVGLSASPESAARYFRDRADPRARDNDTS